MKIENRLLINAPKYKKRQKVNTLYGKGKIIKIYIMVYKEEIVYIYKIKHSLFKNTLYFEEEINEGSRKKINRKTKR